MADFVKFGRRYINWDNVASIDVPKEPDSAGNAEAIHVNYVGGQRDTITHAQGANDILDHVDSDRGQRRQTRSDDQSA